MSVPSQLGVKASTVLCGDKNMDLKTIHFVSTSAEIAMRFETDFSIQQQGFSSNVGNPLVKYDYLKEYIHRYIFNPCQHLCKEV